MKLAKRISKGIALCATLVIIGWGGVTSCSNGSDEPEAGVEKTISAVDEVLFEVTENSVGSKNTNIVFNYDRSKEGAKEKITIRNCDIEIFYNDESLITITDMDFSLNEYDDIIGDKAMQYQCKKSIGQQVSSGDTVKVVFNKKTGNVSGEGVETANIDTLTVSLIDNDEQAKWYKELVENSEEYQPLFPEETTPPTEDEDNNQTDGEGEGTTPPVTDNDNNQTGGEGEGTTPPTEDEEVILYKLDFSGAELPKNDYSTNKENDENAKFVPNEGVQLKTAWKEFAIVTDNMNLIKDATHVKVNFKCSDDAAFAEGDNDNNKFMIGVYKQNEEYTDTNISWTCFLKGGEDEFPKDYKTVEKAVTWEQKYTAGGKPIPAVDFTDINGFRIWDCNFTTGTLWVKSIEFIKK